MASRGSAAVGLSPVAGVAGMASISAAPPAPRPSSSSVTLQPRAVFKPDRPERHTPLSPSTHFSVHDHRETAPLVSVVSVRSAQSSLSRLFEIADSAVEAPLEGLTRAQAVSQQRSDNASVPALDHAAVLVEAQVVPSAADLLLGETISRFESLKRSRRAKSANESAPPVVDTSAAYPESPVAGPLFDMQASKESPSAAIAQPSSSSQSPGPSLQVPSYSAAAPTAAPTAASFVIDDIVSVVIDRANNRSPVSPICAPATGVVEPLCALNSAAAAPAATTATATDEFTPPAGLQADIIIETGDVIGRALESDKPATSPAVYSQKSSDNGQSHPQESAAPARQILPHVALHLAAAQSLREVIDAKIRSSLQHAHDISNAAAHMQTTRESFQINARESTIAAQASDPDPSKATDIKSTASNVVAPAPLSCDEEEDLTVTAVEPPRNPPGSVVGLNLDSVAPSSSSLIIPSAIDTSCMQTCVSDTAGDSMRSRGPDDFTDDDAAAPAPATATTMSSPVFATTARRTEDSFTESIAFNPCIIPSMVNIDRIAPLNEAFEPREHEARAVYWPSALVHPSLLPDSVLVPDLISPSTLRRAGERNRFTTLRAAEGVKGRQELPMVKADKALSPSRRSPVDKSPTPLPGGATLSLLLKTVMSPRRGGEQ